MPDTGIGVEGHREEKYTVSNSQEVQSRQGPSLLKTIQWLPVACGVQSIIPDVAHKAVGDVTFVPLSSLTLFYPHWASKSSFVGLSLLPSFLGIFAPWDGFTEVSFEQGLEACLGDFQAESDGD